MPKTRERNTKFKTYADINKERLLRQKRIFEVANALHDADFRSLSIESTQIAKEEYWVRILIDERELSPDRMATLVNAIGTLGAGVRLFLDNDHRGLVTRLGVWVTP